MAEVDGVEPMENGTGPDEEGEQVKCDIILDKGTADGNLPSILIALHY